MEVHKAPLIIIILNKILQQRQYTQSRIYKSTESHGQFCSDQWAQVNYTISVVHVALSYPSANVI